MCLKTLKAQHIRVQFAICAVKTTHASLVTAAFTSVASLPHIYAFRIETTSWLPYLT
jgi:hypothetical protein